MKKPKAGTKKPGAKAKSKTATVKAKGRSIKNDAGATNTPPVKHETKQIGTDDFERLVKRTTSLKKQTKEISSSMGELVAKAVADKNLDKPAFDMFRKLFTMSPQKRLTTLACFDFYREIPIDGKLLDADETGQGELQIPRQEASGEPKRKKGDEPAKDTTGASAKAPAVKDDKVVDLRPASLRTPAEGGTRVDHVEDLKQASGATGSSGEGAGPAPATGTTH